MNQILISEKLIVTPEMRRKKKFYKFNFFISVFLICILFSYYIYAEYDRNKNEKELSIKGKQYENILYMETLFTLLQTANL